MTRYWKVLDAWGRSCHGGDLKWSLPTRDGERWTPGKWMPRIDDIELCERGYHLCRDKDLLDWLHERIYRVEIAKGAEIVRADDKVVTSGPVRLVEGTAWNEETARLFAVSCALDVLPIYEQAYPDNTHVGNALVTAWEYAHGFASDRERAAAYASALDAGDATYLHTPYAITAAAYAVAVAAYTAAYSPYVSAAAAYAIDASTNVTRARTTHRLLRYLQGEVDV